MMLSQYRDALKDAKKCIELDPTFVKVIVFILKTIKNELHVLNAWFSSFRLTHALLSAL